MSLKSKGSVHILSLWGVLRCQGVYDLSGASPLGHFRLGLVTVRCQACLGVFWDLVFHREKHFCQGILYLVAIFLTGL